MQRLTVDFGSPRVLAAVVKLDSLATSAKTCIPFISNIFLMNRGLTDEALVDLLQIAHGNECKRIVFLSSIAAKLPELTLGKLHLQQEQRILASPIQARIVRATAFMSNTLQWAESIK